MFEDFSYGVRRIATFATGRGASSLIVAGAVGTNIIAPSAWVPAFGLALGIPVSALLATMDHKHTETRLRDTYRKEIASALDILPNEVTTEHLHMVAEGTQNPPRPANRVLLDALERNDRARTISLTATILSAVVTIGAVAAFATVGPLAATISAGIGVGATGVALLGAGLAAATSFGLDVVMKHVGSALFGYDAPSLESQIESIGKGIRHGQNVGIEPLMGLVVEANPRIAKEIQSQYGLTYATLPPEVKRDVAARYDTAFALRSTAEALNLGLLPVTELPFTIEGVQSGAHPDPAELVADYHERHMPDSQAQGHGHIYQHLPERAKNFVDHLEASRPVKKAESWGKHVSDQAMAAMPRTLH